MEKQRIDDSHVITVCPKCMDVELQSLCVSDKPDHVFCNACGDYPIPDIWKEIESRRGRK